MTFYKPCLGRIRTFDLNGVNLLEYVQKIELYENLQKSHLTAHITLLDNNNLIDNLNLVGGEHSTVSFDSPPNSVTYNATLKLLNIKGHQSPNNLKTQIYELDLIGESYLRDQSNLVQKAFGQITATQAIQNVWNQFLGPDTLQILEHSAGMLGKQNDTSTIDNIRPLAAIKKLMKYAVFPVSTSGVPLLFRDRNNVKLSPLENLFRNLSSQEFFIQKETWGANFFDPYIYNAIIEAHADIDPDNPHAGRSSIADIPRVLNQSQIVFDHFNGKIAVNKIASRVASGIFSGTPIGNLVMSVANPAINGIIGGIGGSPNIQTTQSNRWARGTAPDTKTAQERLYSTEARSGPRLKLKVPLQSGINVTIGKGVQVQLMPPVGDLTNFNMLSYDMSGQWLVQEICHVVYGDKRETSGLTYMTLLRGGLST